MPDGRGPVPPATPDYQPRPRGSVIGFRMG